MNRWLVPAIYAAVTLLLFRRFVFSDAMLFGSDTLGLGYIARDFFAGALKSTGFPFWNPYILGGTPFVESLAGGDAIYPTSLLLLAMDPHRALGWKLVVHVFAAGLFMYGWLRALALGRPAAFLGGLAYLMAPVLVTLVWPGHDGKMFVTALTPLAFWMLERAWGRDLRWLVGLAAVIGLVILTTHFQMAYFLFGAMGLYALFLTVERARGGQGLAAAGRFGLFLAAAVAGAGVAAVQFLPAVDYVTSDSRRTATTTTASEEANIAYSSSWSLHPEEVMALLVPQFVGSDIGAEPEWTRDTYWGRNQFKHNHEYFGLAVLLLASLALGRGGRRPGVRWFFVGLGSLALLYTLGRHTPVWRLFYEIVPGVSLFRVPSIAVFLTAFSAITLAAMGVDRALAVVGQGTDEAETRSLLRRLWIFTGVMVVLLLLAASGILFSGWTGVLYRELSPDRAAVLQAARPIIVAGFFWSTVIAAAVAGVWELRRRGTFNAGAVVAALGLILALDAFRVDDPFIQPMDFQRWAGPTATSRFLEQQASSDSEPFRVFSMIGLRGQDVKPALYGLELVGGHHPNDLARYRELIGMEGSEEPRNLLRHPVLLSLLNARYLLWPTGQTGPPFEGAVPLAGDQTADGRLVNAVYELPSLPRARLLNDVVVRDGDQVMPYLLSADFDPATQVVLAEAPPTEIPEGPAQGSVRWGVREPDRAELTVESDRPSLLVVADNWTDRWRADVNGSPAPVLRAYHTLRAIPVPAGASTVRLWYDASGIRTAFLVSLAAVVTLLGILAALTLIGRREPASVDRD